MYHHATPSPQHHPSRRRRGDRVQISRLTARHTRAVFTGHVHRIPSLRLITTTDSASRVRARATLYPRQPIPRSEPGHVPACVFSVTSAPAPSCMGSHASYTWQQLSSSPSCRSPTPQRTQVRCFPRSVWELAVDGRSNGQSPLRINDHHAPLVPWGRSIRWVFFLRCRVLHTMHRVRPTAC
jgi:hypothetical protein